MRIYISSTFEDLREHRAAVIQVLRQLGHDVVAMETYVSENTVPLEKVLKDVESCEVLIEIVAWRYGYIPKKGPDFAGVVPGETSITDYEYRKAVEKDKIVLAFLLDEQAPWPAYLMDGIREPKKAAAITTFRAELRQTRLVAFFSTPDNLASRVAAAVGTVGMRNEINKQLVEPFMGSIHGAFLESFTTPGYLSDSHTMPIIGMVSNPTPVMAASINISTTWWSTRLYLLAAIGQKLGDLRRIIILDYENENERFVGMVSASSVRLALRRIHPQADKFDKRVLSQAAGQDIEKTARRYLQENWNEIIGANAENPETESKIAIPVNTPNLRLWLGESLIETPLLINNLKSATVIDLLRILDYPNDFVPVVSPSETGDQKVQLVNKKELTDRLARNTIVEMLDRLGIR